MADQQYELFLFDRAIAISDRIGQDPLPANVSWIDHRYNSSQSFSNNPTFVKRFSKGFGRELSSREKTLYSFLMTHTIDGIQLYKGRLP